MVNGNNSRRYFASGFRTAALATPSHNIFQIENPAASGKSVRIRRLRIEADATAADVTVAMALILRTAIAGAPGGTVVTAAKADAASAAPVAVVRCATASDGGAATAITAGAVTARLTSKQLLRPRTVAGYNTDAPDTFVDAVDFIALAPGEALLVQVNIAAVATSSYVVNVDWYEDP